MRTLNAWMCELGLVLVIGAVAGPAAADCASVLKFETKATISVEQLARLGGREFKSAGDNYLLSVAVFRQSERPDRSGWRALAIIGADEIGMGVDSLGGVLWTTRPDQFGAQPLRIDVTPRRARVTAAPRTPLDACPKGFTFEVDSEGAVTLNGARWGRVGP